MELGLVCSLDVLGGSEERLVSLVGEEEVLGREDSLVDEGLF